MNERRFFKETQPAIFSALDAVWIIPLRMKA
jgi:hypothetical protein